MADLSHELAEDLESRYIKKEIHVLLYHLQGLPEAMRARIQGELTQSLLERTISVETPRGPVAYMALNRASAGHAATMLTKQPATIRHHPVDRPARRGVRTAVSELPEDRRARAYRRHPGGGERTLTRAEVREVHVEASESSASGRRTIEALKRFGLVLNCAAFHGASDLTFVRARLPG